MDAFLGGLGAAALLAGAFFLFRGLAVQGKSSTSGRLKAGIAAALIGGTALIGIGWAMYLGSTGATGMETGTGIETGTTVEAPPVAGFDVGAAIGGLAGVFGGFILLWWLAFGLIPDLLARRRDRKKKRDAGRR